MDRSRQTRAVQSRLSRGTPILNPLVAVLFVACSRSSPPDVFTDEVSGFAVTKPAGWFMQSGVVLKAQARDEARRFKDPQFGPRPDGSPVQAVTRITRYEPGKAPRTNPTIVVVRFDLHQFPPGTPPDALLKMGVATANPEGEAVTVTLGGRLWRKLVATRLLTDLAGQQVAIRQEVYVLTGDPWGIDHLSSPAAVYGIPGRLRQLASKRKPEMTGPDTKSSGDVRALLSLPGSCHSGRGGTRHGHLGD